MNQWILMTTYQLQESLAAGGWKTVLSKRVFLRREGVPVEIDLTGSPRGGDQLEKTGCRFIELTPADVGPGGIPFLTLSRANKAVRNLRRGWRGFALVCEGMAVGDVWCVTRGKHGDPATHPDLRMLFLQCSEDEAYAFDMFIDPSSRGKNLAVLFHRSLHDILRREGFRKVYGFFWKDNLPALWMHRMLKFREIPSVQVSRFFFLQYSTHKG